jgi:hypothetical protein
MVNSMNLNLSAAPTPFLDLCPAAARDPALIYTGERLQCYYTNARRAGSSYHLRLEVVETEDLLRWSAPRCLADSPLGFSSPGNIMRVGQDYILCVQSYPVDPGAQWGNETCRLWLMRSRDLQTWGEPQMIYPQGCQARWANSRRQIDPYLVQHAGAYYCFYKTNGQLGLLVSLDLEHWEEASPDRPVLSGRDTPDGASLENPCVVPVEGGNAMIFAPCRPGRGIGLAYSADLIHWRDVHYLDFPALPWADNGPSAAMVVDLRRETGHWLMAFHGEREVQQDAHSAALALAWGDDLDHWRLP